MSKQLTSLRVFVFLLLTMFISETVYAAGMMAAVELHTEHHSALANDTEHEGHTHQHNQHHQSSLDDHHKSQDKSTSTNNCTKCGNCMACFTVLPSPQIENLPPQHMVEAIVLFKVSYISHLSAQPEKPPIATINS